MITGALAAVALLSPVGGQSTPSIEEFTQPSLRDATFVARRVRAVQSELRKINADFGNSYRFDKVSVQAKEPFMLRLEATVDDTRVLYIIDGPIQVIRVPRARISQTLNLSDAPGRRQTWLDFGLLTPSLFNGFFTARFVRLDRATNQPVFDIRYDQTKFDDTSRHRIWIDPERKIVAKREWFNQQDRHIATFFYEKPVKENGVWMPTEMTVRNVENKVAGTTRYSSFEANTGLASSLFDVR